MAKQFITVVSGGAAMSFEEIARELGYPEPKGNGSRAVRSLYLSGMRKLRQRRRVMARLSELSTARQQVLEQREAAAERIP